MTIALTIAGSDSSGGAGIQADLKTFSALGVYGMSIVTALTAQNTLGVDDVLPISADFVKQQFYSIINDSQLDSLKIGMLMNEEIVIAVSQLLLEHPMPYIVLDTVMIAKGGHRLLQLEAIKAIKQQLLPLATIITPNLLEAAALLSDSQAIDERDMRRQGRELLQLGCKAVLMKGGHLAGSQSVDYLIMPEGEIRLAAPRIVTNNTHGTGCTLSAAIAALLPQTSLVEAVEQAKHYLLGAIEHADTLKIGQGIGPTHHFYQWW
ncbi:hydroxymethylpyrimidine kinase /phosphomethylpyrimidine kinase [Orbus hercynius]|uniref:hydroxymethylpyrimidine kinase n=1 Tax=Orbus hercynius TaxID=593135 RepID=A0A495RBX5_9GAMM|nr:bifunctional hydroxymethylpyrimidine kinase/phosphomethylpyrimidine kinase [Orbus hercynius]RKS84766.1 hydroxymethylpyrimidine kinase /phosphomethylpyrimidine kinase [Orbus hercynius]